MRIRFGNVAVRFVKAIRTPKRLVALLCAVVVLLFLAQHWRSPIWFRADSHRLSFSTSIHRDGEGYVLRREQDGRVGTLTCVRTSKSIDDRPVFTHRREHTRFKVTIDGRSLDGAARGAWRPREALHFVSAVPLEKERMTKRMLWLGYPGEWLAFLAMAAAVAVPVLLLFLFATACDTFLRVFSPEARRCRAIERGMCPECRYDLRGLPACRCPECGESWTVPDSERVRTQRTVRPDYPAT